MAETVSDTRTVDESALSWEERGGTWLDNLVAPGLGPVGWLGELAPSGQLLSEMERLPADLIEDDYDHLEMVAHWNRVEAYCAARKRLAAAALARRVTMSTALAQWDGTLGIARSDPNVAADEIALRLGVTRRAALRLVASGRAMSGVALPTAEALLEGEIDAAKADLMIEAVSELPSEAALDVQERVLERAGHLPAGAIRRELASACAAVDPSDYEQRCAQARQGRRVCRPRVLPHGMASLYAVLPAVEATGLYRALDGAARSAGAAGDPRTLDQLRADALATMGAAALETGWIGLAPTPARPSDAGPAAQAGEGAGCGMRVGAIGGRSAHVRVVVTLATAMGGSGPGTDLPGADEPGHLEGYGPIPASVARAVAAGGTWARLVLDPIDHSVRELSAETYRPPLSMAELARAEQPRCVRPGCEAAADTCDLNHAVAWPLGKTSVDNLDPLCRRDHRLITHGGWAYADTAAAASTSAAAPPLPGWTPADGSMTGRTWTTATGHRYRQAPTGAISMVPRAPRANDPPPF